MLSKVEMPKVAVSVKKGDSYFLPANSGSYTVQGSCQTLDHILAGQ